MAANGTGAQGVLSGEARAFLVPKEAAAVFARLKASAANKVCFDCPTKNPTWCSIPFGVYLCMQCSAGHRQLGTHITFIRSSILDKWDRPQLLQMVAGGNKRAKEFFKARGWTAGAVSANSDRKDKYTSRAATLYRAQLEKEARAAGPALDELLRTSLGGSLSAAAPAAAAAAAPRKEALLDTDTGLEDMLAAASSPSGSPPPPAQGGVAPTPSPPPRVVVRKVVPGKQVRRVVRKKPHAHNTASLASEPDHLAAEHLAQMTSVRKAGAAKPAGARKAGAASLLTTSRKKPAQPSLSTRRGPAAAAAAPADDDDEFDRQFAALSMEDRKRKQDAAEAARRKKEEEANMAEEEKAARAEAEARAAQERAEQESLDRAKAAAAKAKAKKDAEGRKVPPPWHERRNAAQAQQAQQAQQKSQVKLKGVSSDQFFGRNEHAAVDPATRAKINSFNGARGISSDQFFDREQAGGGHAGSAGDDSVDLGDLVAEKGRQLKSFLDSFRE